MFLDAAGNSYLGGDFVGANAIVAPSGSIALNYVGLRDAYVCSWTPNGNLRWYKDWGGNGVELCKGIATNDQLEVYLVGPFAQTSSFDGQLLSSAGEGDLFIWKTDSLGNTLWLKQISSLENITGGEVVVDPNGGVIGGISIIEEAAFQTNGLDTIIQTNSTQKWPAFIQYNTNGSLNQVHLPDDAYSGRFGEISRSGNTVYLDVEYNGEIDFSGNIINTDQLSNRDGAIVSLSLDDSTLSNEQISEQDYIENLYPNPTNGKVSITFEQLNKKISLHVFNSLGKLVDSKQLVKPHSYTFSLPQTSGVYFIKLIYSNGKTRIFKVVKE